MVELIQFWEKDATVRVVAGNNPLPLDDPEIVWLTTSGRIDVFATPVEHGRQVAARRHLLRVEAGNAMFGMRSAGLSPDIELLASGLPGTSVFGIRRSRLTKVSRDQSLVGQVSALIDAWVQGVTSAIATESVPKICTLLESGKEVLLEDCVASSLRAILWVRYREGGLHFLGRQQLLLDALDGLSPLCSPAWLSAGGKVQLYPMNTESILADPALWFGLDAFHQTILRCVALNAQAILPKERTRLLQSAEADRRLMQTSLLRLAAVSGMAPAGDLDEGDQGDALLLACRLVGRALGIDVRSPGGFAQGKWSGDRLREIAQTSRFRVRRVLLAGDWWHSENGPLLAFRRADERPVALLPTSSRSYELVDHCFPGLSKS